ncbi:hypothetical protein ACLBYD_26290 [Rhodococcus sp. C26F]
MYLGGGAHVDRPAVGAFGERLRNLLAGGDQVVDDAGHHRDQTLERLGLVLVEPGQ